MKLNSSHIRELVDRSSILVENIDRYIVEYEGLMEQYPGLCSIAERAVGTLSDFYHAAGSIMFDLEDEEASDRAPARQSQPQE